MPVPSAPSNVWVQVGDNYNYLSWDNTATATSYKVQRSVDGVTFADLATPTVNSYSDSSVSSAVNIAGTGLVVGFRYQIASIGTSTQANFNAIGVPTSVAPAVGVTFTATATGAGVGTGQVAGYGNKYFYQVAAINGSGTGAYTATDPTGAALSAVALAPGLVSLGELRLLSQERADRVNSNFVTLPEWNKYITLSYKELYDLLTAAYGNDYYVKTPYTYTTPGTVDPNYGAQVFPLPADFYKLLLCEVALNPSDPNSWVTLRQYERIQQNLWNFPNVYTFYGITNLRYRLTGSQIQIVPIASSGQTIRIWYAPRPAKLVQDTDIVDGISGWETFVVVSAARKALMKEESECAEIDAEYLAMKERLEAMAANRNVAEPQKVSDSRLRNFAWGNDGSDAGGGMW